jgi:hypothetical protein
VSPVHSAARRLSWAAPTLVLLALVLALAACGDVAEVAPSPSTSLTSLLGYWRPVEVSEGVEVQLIRIAREGETYTIDAPPVYADRELTVAGERLELREEAGGETVYVAAFMLEPGAERLVQAHYFAAPFSGDPQVRTLYERAEGSAEDLAEEIRQWWANTTAQEQIETLDHAVGLWSAEHGRYPLEEEMRPEGAFWQSPQAPEMVNAFTGAPLELGEGLGEFSYELTEDDEGRSRTISIHLYGGEDASATQWEAL